MVKILHLIIKIKHVLCRLLVCIGVILTLPQNANAQTVNWIGAISTDYGTSTNWDIPSFNPLAPIGTEIVIIGAGNPNDPIQVGGNSTKRIAKLNTLPGAQFTVRGILYPNNSDMINGLVSVEGNADFNIRNAVTIGNGAQGTVTVSGGSLSSRTVLYVGRNAGGVGTLNIWGGKVNAGTDFQVGTNGGTGSVSFKSVGTLTVPGNKVPYLQALLSSGIITVDGNRPLDIVYNATKNLTTASIFQDPNSLLKEYATDVVLDNGTIKATIHKSSGEVLSLLYKGKEMVSTSGSHTKIYYDWTSSYGFETMGNCTFSVKKLNDSIVDVSFKRVYAPAAGQVTPADIDIHYVLKKNDTGLYTYSVTEHQPSYPNVDLGSWRMVMWIGNDGVKNLCEKIYVDEKRHWEMPAPADYATAQPTPIQEIIKLTTGARAGKYDGKYEYSKSLWELNAVGHASDVNHVGSWFVYGSHEFFNDGPSFDDLNAAAGIIHSTMNGVHYNSKGFVIPQGEYWRKIYGPFLIYFNDKTTGDEAWVDAKERSKVENSQWPYAWLDNNPEYPLQNARGSVSGKFTIHDPFKPAIHGDSAWIGVTQLSNPDNQWQFEAKNYHYWVKTDIDGNFTIPDIRPGTYSLFAYKKGEVGEYSLANVAVTAGANNNVGELVWNIPRNKGGLAWEIGIPDRTASEFKYGDFAYMEGYLWDKFGSLFNNPIEYNVADKNWSNVLNYVQSPYPDTSGVMQPWKWRLNFDLPTGLPTTGNATLTIAYASSDHANQYIFVNNEASRFTNLYPPNAGGNALLRQENHAKYGVATISIPMSRLRGGKNTITLVMASTSAMANHIMYDYLSLEVPGIPTAKIVAAPTMGKGPLTVAFDAGSSLHILKDSLLYNWDFGDGAMGAGVNTTHTYSIHGVYKAKLQVTDHNNKSDTTSVNITVLNNAPVAAFTATPTVGYAPLNVAFDASLTHDIDHDSIRYVWNFGDGTSATGVNATHIYAQGTYKVLLIAFDNSNASDTTSVTLTVLNNAPVAAFKATQTTGYAPLPVAFDASLTHDIDHDSISYLWNFGDGTTGVGMNATHTYLHGVYHATLIASDNGNASDTTSVTITARNNAPVAAFTATPTSGYAPLLVTLDASLTHDVDHDSITYSWNFGDGATAIGLHIQHLYTSPGTFTIVLTATDNLGASNVTTTTITVASGLKVQYMVERRESDPFDSQINPNIKIVNISTNPVPYNELSVRYWYTKEGLSNQLFKCEFAALGTFKVKGNFIPLAQPRKGSDYYLELTFTSTSTISPNGNSGEIDAMISKVNRSAFDERDDYSFDPTKKNYTDWDHITLFRNGKLFWGVEPDTLSTPPSGPGPGEHHPHHVYPNPTHGQLHVDGTLSERGDVIISVYTLLGSRIIYQDLGSHAAGEVNKVIDMSSLPPGIYYVWVRLANNSFASIVIKE